MKSNEGIILKGGNLNANQLAVGKSPTITINSFPQKNDIIDKVNSLLAVLEKEKSNIDNYDDVKKAGESVRNELDKEKPDNKVLSVLLSMISNSIPAISSVTKAIKVINEAIALIMK